jgi:hypothetical protein
MKRKMVTSKSWRPLEGLQSHWKAVQIRQSWVSKLCPAQWGLPSFMNGAPCRCLTVFLSCFVFCLSKGFFLNVRPHLLCVYISLKVTPFPSGLLCLYQKAQDSIPELFLTSGRGKDSHVAIFGRGFWGFLRHRQGSSGKRWLMTVPSSFPNLNSSLYCG